MKANVLGVAIDRLAMGEVINRLSAYVEEGEPHIVITANPEIIYMSAWDSELKTILSEADLVTADGEGVVWAARLLGAPVPERVTGIDLLQNLLIRANAHNWRVFFLGAKPGIAVQAAEKLLLKYPGIEFASSHGYFKPGAEEQELVNKIKSFKPHILAVGLGAPRQEKWIWARRRELGVPVAMGVGGSFDVLSGNVTRAPLWLQKLRLEWFVRLVSQPWRLKRQTVLPKFVFAVFKQKFTDNPHKK